MKKLGMILTLVGGGKEVQRLKQENDSLIQVNVQTKADFEEMLQLMNEVEDGFRQMKEAENYLIVQQNATGDVDKTTREKLKSDMQLVAQTLKENKEKLARLQSQLKNSKYQSSQLKQTVDRLSAEIESKTAMITSLQEDLAVEMASDRYQLSKYHSKGQKIVTDEERLYELVPRLLLDFSLFKTLL